ncbi:MAG: hypothetical protein ACOCY1_04450 [Halovenus sp.]
MTDGTEDRYTDSKYIDAVEKHQPAGTSEVAEEVGVARQSADYRLRRLRDAGKVTSKMIGGSLAWSVVDE